ncbi:MAG: outer membrane beta-barrel protein [Sulfurimonas sp.]|uniref:outer membrane protein n=1 Tax=Sulfurimonas sp. TaxID=2022749 RepID=UPI0028CF40AE|nr:outer membrane beta-barrel protein [Sulfurimonas sp.]MDT8339446.1 outer membrane beta-barrel protein [Sulfurimonas sp.]
MKKIALAVLLASGLMAAENADYFGISFGNAELGVDLSVPGLSASTEVDDKHISFTLGHYYEDTARVWAGYSYVDTDSDVDDADAFSIGYDFILPLAENRLSLYADPVIGYTRYEEPGIDISGFHYGAQAGVIVRLIDNIEIEAGYRYLMETGSDTVNVSGIDVDIDADDLKMWYVGANLRF